MIPEHLRDALILRVPGLHVETAGPERVRVSNLALGSRAELPRAVVELLDRFAQPKTLADGLSGLDMSFLELLGVALEHAFLIDVEMMVAPLEAKASSVGPASSAGVLLRQESVPDVVVFGAPYDAAVDVRGHGGARHGAREIRDVFGAHGVCSFTPSPNDEDIVFMDMEWRRLYQHAPSLADVGDVVLRPGESGSSYGARVEAVTGLIADRGAVPCLLGGDHSITHYALSALLERHERLGVLHFDAHDDDWPEMMPTFRYVTHGNMMYHARKSANLTVLRHLGLRTFDRIERSWVGNDPRVSYRSSRELERGSIQDAFDGLSTDIPYYVTIDIDVLDPRHAPEASTPLRGGLSYYRLLELIDAASRHFTVVGWDLMETCESTGQMNGAAHCAAGLLERILLAKVPYEPLTAHVPSPPR